MRNKVPAIGIVRPGGVFQRLFKKDLSLSAQADANRSATGPELIFFILFFVIACLGVLRSLFGRKKGAYVHCVSVGRAGRYIGDAAVKGFPHPGRIVATNRYFVQLHTGSSNAGNVGVCRWFIGRGSQV